MRRMKEVSCPKCLIVILTVPVTATLENGDVHCYEGSAMCPRCRDIVGYDSDIPPDSTPVE